ncbi:methyltransferase [Methanocella sp. CWC-04]|uniref:Methyltransferase n=1 Tax=Methanooceanicella nereidis TaxID=2052831 RepID=A0AAP2W5B0_9EURY|nr:class I SAM-dependent methyltransferase [Methanocella sp. CWC-04]MCD1295290.1 methyltransferase [Methanocella sp. CWC-04]
MFNDMPTEIKERMEVLSRIDEMDRKDGTPHLKRLRQIPAETGKFLALSLSNAPAGTAIEIGTSAGYSTLWMALACRETGGNIITFEILEEKAIMAKETFRAAKVDDIVELINGDAKEFLNGIKDISFCFVDCEKEYYAEYYEAIIPKMVSRGLFLADNAISHGDVLKPFIDNVLSDENVDAMIVPVGKGVLYCRKR